MKKKNTVDLFYYVRDKGQQSHMVYTDYADLWELYLENYGLTFFNAQTKIISS